MVVGDLKALLKDRGLPVSGRKVELIQRLEESSGATGDVAKKEEVEETPKKVEDKPRRVVALPPHISEEEKEAEEKKEPEADKDGPQPPYGSTLPDPHAGKPESIVDKEGRTRYLCLDGQYRRGDPDAIECKPENFSAWLTEWVVAARTGQLEGKPQKTFLPKEPENPGNPKGSSQRAGTEMKSEEVLVRLDKGSDDEPKWEYRPK